jgi:hypothetical protein
MEHLGFQYLIKYLEGGLDETEHREAEAHLAACAECQRELAGVRRTLVRVREFVPPPSELLHRVLAAFHRRKARLTGRPRRQAALRSDSWTHLAALGVRGVPQERQLLFTEGAFNVDVQIVRDDLADTFALQGQVLEDEPQPGGMEGIELCIADAAGVERRGLTDQFGCFSFTQLAEGTYSLQIVFDDHDIVLDSVVVADSWAGQEIN